MITRNSNTKRTLITIENYGVYQDVWDTGVDTNKDTDVYTGVDTGMDTGMPQTTMNNNENNINNILSENLEDTQKAKTAKEIIEYLNVILGSRYTTKNKTVMSMIHARLVEGHTFEDFKIVIDKKNKQWRSDPRMVGYLRPETLFCATHFESYLNEKVVDAPQKKPSKANTGIQTHGYDFAALEEEAFGSKA